MNIQDLVRDLIDRLGMRRLAERVVAYTTSTARLIFSVGLVEFIRAPRFRYDFDVTGPREEDRARYVSLRERITQLRLDIGNGSRSLVAQLQQELDAIPLERKWASSFWNTVVTVGKNDLLDKYFAGSSYTAAWYLGLSAPPATRPLPPATVMSSHSGWLEAGSANAPTYSQSTRPAPSWSSASSGSKATSSAVAFSITGTGTAKGGFLTTVSTKDGATGVLYSAGLSSGGDRAVVNGDIGERDIDDVGVKHGC
jgi:hypothetical protein